MELSVVIPAYNESKKIEKTIKQIVAYLDDHHFIYELIIVDDGSLDTTNDTVMRLITQGKAKIVLLRNDKNMGKGFSVRRGVVASSKDYILFTDADLSTPIEETDKLLSFLKEGFDIAIGSRRAGGAVIELHQPWYREKLGQVFNLFIQLLLFRGIKDTQCGFKCFKRDVAKRIFGKARLNRFSFDAEILYLAKRLGYRIKEVPVRWLNDPETKVGVIKNLFSVPIEILKIRFLHKF